MDRIAALGVYVRIVELGSFSAAATEQRLRQATVSRWIAALEEELQAQLLDRTTRGIRVTEAGQRFYQQAREVLEAWSGAVAGAKQAQEEVSGRLRVSLPVVFGQMFVSPDISGFMERYPRVELELLFAERYVDLVEEGVDLALRVGRSISSDYRARLLGETPRLLVASPGYLAQRGEPRCPEDLREHLCLLHSGLNNRESWVFSQGKKDARVELRGRFSANHSATLLEMALAGQGIALLAEWLVKGAVEEGRLKVLLRGYEAPRAPVQVLFASAKHPARVVRAFVDFLEESFARKGLFDARLAGKNEA